VTHIDNTCTHMNRKKILVCFLRSKLPWRTKACRKKLRQRFRLCWSSIFKKGSSSRFTYIGIKKKQRALALSQAEFDKVFFCLETCWTELENFLGYFKISSQNYRSSAFIAIPIFFLHYRPITEYRKNSW
jgi:hypothetical protein